MKHPRLDVLLLVGETVTIMLASSLLIKDRTLSDGTGAGKFGNPLKNLNIVIIIVIAGFTLMQVLTYYIRRPPGLIFPSTPQAWLLLLPPSSSYPIILSNPQGLDMAAMMWLFLLR